MKFGDLTLTDSMMRDGLTCAFGDCHMGITAENVARQNSLSRLEQDQFAAQSQNKAEEAQKNGTFTKEIVPVSIPSRKGCSITAICQNFNFSWQALSLCHLMSSPDMEPRQRLWEN